MQVLYQLSYGPIGALDRMTAGMDPVLQLGSCRARGPRLAQSQLTPRWVGPQTWRQTATRRPCTVTWSAGRTIGA
jgi:hypothetical protein